MVDISGAALPTRHEDSRHWCKLRRQVHRDRSRRPFWIAIRHKLSKDRAELRYSLGKCCRDNTSRAFERPRLEHCPRATERSAGKRMLPGCMPAIHFAPQRRPSDGEVYRQIAARSGQFSAHRSCRAAGRRRDLLKAVSKCPRHEHTRSLGRRLRHGLLACGTETASARLQRRAFSFGRVFPSF
jgi:hypothetical protein